MSKTLTLLLMDPPFESANTTTAFRLIEAALRQGHTVNVFAYEGAVNLTMKGQQQHANPAHGKTVEEEHHPLTRDLVAGLFAAGQSERLRWVNCGLCVDERGAGDWIDGPRRGSPADFLEVGGRQRPDAGDHLSLGRRHRAWPKKVTTQALK